MWMIGRPVALGDLVMNFVHRVRREQQAFGARRLDPLGRFDRDHRATPSQSPACCIAANGAMSRLSIDISALCSPPSRAAMPRLICS